MTRLPIYLVVFLCLQVVLTSVIYWQRNQQTGPHQTEPLLSFDRDKLDKIVITGAEQTESAVLTKDKGAWFLTNLNQLPVSQNQLDTALDKLSALTTSWPIATTKTSHQRFELQEDNFQRRIQLFQGGNKIADLLLGSSPGFRKVHLRMLDNDNVYALPLNTFDFPVKDQQWLDKSLLAISAIDSIQGPDYFLIKEQGDWILKSPADKTVPLDQDKAVGLARALSNLRVLELVTEPPVFVGSAVKTLIVKGEQQHNYQFLEFEGKYYVKQQITDKVFTLNQIDYQRITGVDLAGLTRSESETGTKAESTGKSVPLEIE